jgi:hypothetical protein
MSQTLKVLGQAAPAINTLTALYTVPGATQTTVSTIYCCNQTGGNIKFRVSVAIAGAVDTPSQYLYYDVLLTKNNAFAATVGLTLGATDVIRVQTDTANVSFSAFGIEVT